MLLSIFIYSLMAIVLCFTLAIIRHSNYINSTKNFFYSFASIYNIVILLALVLLSISLEKNIEVLGKISNFIIYSLSPLVSASLALSTFKTIGLKKSIIVLFIPVVFLLFMFVEVVFDKPFVVDNNGFNKNPLYLISYILSSFYFVLWGFVSMWSHRDNDKKEKAYINFSFLLCICALVFQAFFQDVYVLWVASAILIVLSYMFNVEVSSEYDVMTEVRNRAAYDTRIQNYTRKSNYTVVILDVNRLKYVNDTFGHKKGDELIILVANAISKTFYRMGQTYRIGGDEFVVLCDFTEYDEIKEKCRKLVDKLKNVNLNIDYAPSVSWGLCTHSSDDEEEYVEALKIADSNMYEMKQWFHKMQDEGKDPYNLEHDWEAIWFYKEKNEFEDKK